MTTRSSRTSRIEDSLRRTPTCSRKSTPGGPRISGMLQPPGANRFRTTTLLPCMARGSFYPFPSRLWQLGTLTCCAPKLVFAMIGTSRPLPSSSSAGVPSQKPPAGVPRIQELGAFPVRIRSHRVRGYLTQGANIIQCHHSASLFVDLEMRHPGCSSKLLTNQQTRQC